MWVSSCTVCSALDVSNNNFASGSFPSGLTALTGLKSLSVANDGITGAIPDSISQFTSLWYGISLIFDDHHPTMEQSGPESFCFTVVQGSEHVWQHTES